jgi:hypothetical protein
MDSSRYAYYVFTKHFQLAKIERDFICLELRPGDTLFSALVARALRADKIILVEVGDYANRSMDLYKGMYEFLLKQGYSFNVDLTYFDKMMN